MPISSGAGGKPNSYFNPANAAPARRASVGSVGYVGGGGGGGGGYYYGGYYDGPYGNGGATPRGVQIAEMQESPARVSQNGQASVGRSGGRSCCPCPSRSRQEMRLPQMPRSKLAPTGNAINRRGCCVFLLALLALALAAAIVAGLYFLAVELTRIRFDRGSFFLIPGRRTGDLMWVVYGRTQPCEPDTTAGVTTTTTAVATTTANSTDNATTTAAATTTTVSTTTLIPCASTTFSYVQVTLGAGGWPRPALATVSAVVASALAAVALAAG